MTGMRLTRTGGGWCIRMMLVLLVFTSVSKASSVGVDR